MGAASGQKKQGINGERRIQAPAWAGGSAAAGGTRERAGPAGEGGPLPTERGGQHGEPVVAPWRSPRGSAGRAGLWAPGRQRSVREEVVWRGWG